MSRFKIFLSRMFLSRALERVSPDRIPRSPPKGNLVNCFSVSVDRNAEPYFLVSSIEGDTLVGHKWDGTSYSEDASLSLAEIDLGELFIRHYYGLDMVKYSGILDLAWGRTFFLPYFRIHVHRFLNRLNQFRFDRTRLAIKRRMELLHFLLERQFQAEADIISSKVHFNSMSITSALYSERWILHPEGSAAHQTVEFYLDSLVQSGDLLKKDEMEYVLTAQSLQTAEEYQEQQRKHAESISMQWRMFWLSVAIVLLTLVQAGIVKLPVLLNLSSVSP